MIMTSGAGLGTRVTVTRNLGLSGSQVRNGLASAKAEWLKQNVKAEWLESNHSFNYRGGWAFCVTLDRQIC
jgi:hypothetical protein